MDTSKTQSKLYSFYKAVVTVPAFGACFYLLIVCFAATFRLISDIGSVRVLFLNPLLILLVGMAAIFAAGVYFVKSPKAMNAALKFDDKDVHDRAVKILKIVIFAECLIFTVGINRMGQNVDQLSVQEAAYGYSWSETETFTAPGYLGIYPNNVGMSVALYLLSLVAGHYNNLIIMLIYSLLVPSIYSDLAEIGGKFGMSKKSRVLVMAAAVLFLPLQAKAMIIYGDIPGLFLAVRAMKYAADIAARKTKLKEILVVIVFPAIACVLKNNFLIFSIAITVYLAAELLRQKRYKELYIPAAVIGATVVINPLINLIVGAVAGKAVSSGASKWSWIAMGMQEEAGMYNGYNAFSYAEAGFDANAQSVVAKESIARSINGFMAEPNYAIGFYTRKVLIQWSDPTHCAFEFHSRNVYKDGDASPLMWLLASPVLISAAASVLKLFQLLIFFGSTVFAVKSGSKKAGSPALLLFLTFIGGYVFHLIWEAAPFYTLSYMTILIPVGIAGLTGTIKKLSGLKAKELAKMQFKAGPGVVYFIFGVLVFLFAAAGLGTVRTQLVDGRAEYKAYFSETLGRSRNPIEPGIYYLKPAAEGAEDIGGVKVELTKYAGKYRMRIVMDEAGDDLFLTAKDGEIVVDWFSYDESQVFTVLKNKNGTYSICRGEDRAMAWDSENKKMNSDEFANYLFGFDSEVYEEFISENPGFTWNLVPAF